ncbi:MAG: hypothetical protein ACRD3Y_10330, partial [Bryobacteraceae bacterium]
RKPRNSWVECQFDAKADSFRHDVAGKPKTTVQTKPLLVRKSSRQDVGATNQDGATTGKTA